MASGIEVDEKVAGVLERIKTRKQRFSLFKIANDEKTIEQCEDEEKRTEENLVDLKATPAEAEVISFKVLATLAELLKASPLEPRYIYFNIVLDKDGRSVDKMVLFLYNPDHAKIRSKMLYSSSKDTLKKVITTSFVDVHITEVGELIDYKTIRIEVLTKGGST